MERTVIFRDRQELQSADLLNVQEFARDSIDNIVKDTIESGKGYTGFAVSKTAAAELTVTPGRLYSTGAVYARDESTVIDCFNLLPLVTKKRIAIVAYGQSITTDVQPRDFLIDAETGTTEPQSVAMESARRVELSAVSGVESADPTYPTTDANVTVVAYVLLDTNGVVSIEQWEDTKVKNLRTVGNDLDTLENWKTQIGARVDTLGTDLYALSSAARNFATQNDIQGIMRILSEIIAKLNKPVVTNLYSATNRFYTDSDADDAYSGYDCHIHRGLRFPATISNTFSLQLLNPIDPDVIFYGDICLPHHTHHPRWHCRGYHREHRCGSVTYYNRTWRRLAWSRIRWACGPSHLYPFLVDYFPEVVNNVLSYAKAMDILRHLDGEPGYDAGATFDYLWRNMTDQQQQAFLRAAHHRGLLHVACDEPYWQCITDTHPITAYEHAQTFTVSQDGWLTKVGLYFSRLGTVGDVTVMICEVDDRGHPHIERVLSKTVVDRADLVAGIDNQGGTPLLVETTVPITPTALRSGKKYAMIIASHGDHYIAISDDPEDYNVCQGAFFYGQDGVWTLHPQRGVIKHRMYFAHFPNPRMVINLQPFQLSGGIQDIDIIGEVVELGGSRCVFEGQIGGEWKPISFDNTLDLSTLPAVLPMRVVFYGSTYCHPAKILANVKCTVKRAKTAFKYASLVRNLGGNASKVVVTARMHGYVEDDHNCTCILKTNAGGTTETADVTEDVVLGDGVIERTWTFNIAADNDYRYVIDGTTTSIASQFVISEVREVATS